MHHQPITEGKRLHHVHPTPAHIRECCMEAMADAARAWEAETGQFCPLQHMITAMNAGVTRACQLHDMGVE